MRLLWTHVLAVTAALAAACDAQVATIVEETPVLSFSAKGSALALSAAPAAPGYTAEYPNPQSLTAVQAYIREGGEVVTTCRKNGVAVVCQDAPFRALVRRDADGTYRIALVDIFGKTLAAQRVTSCGAAAPAAFGSDVASGSVRLSLEAAGLCKTVNAASAVQPPRAVPDAGTPAVVDSGVHADAGSPIEEQEDCAATLAGAKQGFCDEVNDYLKQMNFTSKLDCTKVGTGFNWVTAPDVTQSPDFATHGMPMCGQLVDPPQARAATANARLPRCVAQAQIALTEWALDANMQLGHDLVCRMDPWVLDLDGDGVHLSSPADGVPFDIEGDGMLRQVSWPTGRDAFLVSDENHNGRIDDVRELVGDRLAGAHLPDGASALRALDSNDDARIDARDEAFTRLRLWTDRNRNGLSDPGELLPLPAAGIRELELSFAKVTEAGGLDAHDNWLAARAAFIRNDGTRGEMVDAWLSFRPLAAAALVCR